MDEHIFFHFIGTYQMLKVKKKIVKGQYCTETGAVLEYLMFRRKTKAKIPVTVFHKN